MSSSAEMPFLDHLDGLRWRIMWSLAALVVGVVVGFVIVYNTPRLAEEAEEAGAMA